MSDLTKLTAKELRSRFVRRPHDWSLGGRSSMQAPTEEWDEIWLRVERLEKCEAALKAFCNVAEDLLVKYLDAARAALEEK